MLPLPPEEARTLADMTRSRPARFLAPLLLTLGAAGPAAAQDAPDNLRGLVNADLCPPQAYVYVDEKEDEDFAAELDAQLDKYAALYGVSYGDPRTCTVYQTFTVDTFKAAGGRYVFTAAFELELRGEARVNLSATAASGTVPARPQAAPAPRTLTVERLRLWGDQGYGLISRANVEDTAATQVREYYEAFALAWKATHKAK